MPAGSTAPMLRGGCGSRPPASGSTDTRPRSRAAASSRLWRWQPRRHANGVWPASQEPTMSCAGSLKGKAGANCLRGQVPLSTHDELRVSWTEMRVREGRVTLTPFKEAADWVEPQSESRRGDNAYRLARAMGQFLHGASLQFGAAPSLVLRAPREGHSRGRVTTASVLVLGTGLRNYGDASPNPVRPEQRVEGRRGVRGSTSCERGEYVTVMMPQST
jgi:hypothetical protein